MSPPRSDQRCLVGRAEGTGPHGSRRRTRGEGSRSRCTSPYPIMAPPRKSTASTDAPKDEATPVESKTSKRASTKAAGSTKKSTAKKAPAKSRAKKAAGSTDSKATKSTAKKTTAKKSTARKTTAKKSTAKADSELSTEERISKRAYELFEARGGKHGYHHEDWLQAEKEVKGRS